MRIPWPPRDPLLIAAYVGGTLLCASCATEPTRRVLFTGRNGFVSLLLPGVIALVIFAGWVALLHCALRRLLDRWREIGVVRATHPLIALAAFTLVAWFVPWEKLYWKRHWATYHARYEALAPRIAAGQLRLLGQREPFPLALGDVVRLPDADQSLGVFGRATVRAAGTDSAAVLFFTSAWGSDNWTGYVYTARPDARPPVFGGVYYGLRRLGPHWWFVAST